MHESRRTSPDHLKKQGKRVRRCWRRVSSRKRHWFDLFRYWLTARKTGGQDFSSTSEHWTQKWYETVCLPLKWKRSSMTWRDQCIFRRWIYCANESSIHVPEDSGWHAERFGLCMCLLRWRSDILQNVFRSIWSISGKSFSAFWKMAWRHIL